MKLIIVTTSTFFVEEDKILTSLFEEGMENLHLYKTGAAPIYSERLLTLLPEDYTRKITVHDHFYLKDEYSLRGIHLDDASADPPTGYKGRISRTCFHMNELKAAKKRSDYVFLSGEWREENNAKKALLSNHSLIDRHVYAMGNITLDDVKLAKDLGFGGIVVCDDLWDRFDIYHGTDYKEVLTYFEKLRKAVG